VFATLSVSLTLFLKSRRLKANSFTNRLTKLSLVYNGLETTFLLYAPFDSYYSHMYIFFSSSSYYIYIYTILGKAEAICGSLVDIDVRAKTDTRDNYTPGWKYSHWEVKGVPIRLEFGPRDLDNETCVLVRRDTCEKEVCKLADVNERVRSLLIEIQQNLFNQAKAIRDTSTITVMEWKDFVPALDKKKMILTPWCETKDSEEEVKKRSSEESEGGAAKTLCIPFIQPPLKEGTKCFITGKPATVWVLWGRSY